MLPRPHTVIVPAANRSAGCEEPWIVKVTIPNSFRPHTTEHTFSNVNVRGLPRERYSVRFGTLVTERDADDVVADVLILVLHFLFINVGTLGGLNVVAQDVMLRRVSPLESQGIIKRRMRDITS